MRGLTTFLFSFGIIKFQIFSVDVSFWLCFRNTICRGRSQPSKCSGRRRRTWWFPYPKQRVTPPTMTACTKERSKFLNSSSTYSVSTTSSWSRLILCLHHVCTVYILHLTVLNEGIPVVILTTPAVTEDHRRPELFLNRNSSSPLWITSFYSILDFLVCGDMSFHVM